MPKYRIPTQRKVVETIRMTNGSKLTREVDSSGYSRWFRDGKYITPSVLKTYKFYDKSIEGYRQLKNGRDIRIFDGKGVNSATPVYTPTLNKIYKSDKEFLNNATEADRVQSFEPSKKVITLKTKGNMNLADVPVNMLDSIAINSGRSNTSIKQNLGLVGKESTFGGFSHFQGFPMEKQTIFYPHLLTNNHAFFNSPARDYLSGLIKTVGGGYKDEAVAKREKKAREDYDYHHGLVVKTPQYSPNVMADAFKRYAVNPSTYNPGQNSYIPMVNRIGNEVWNEPQIQNWWNTEGKYYYDKGKSQGINYTYAEGGPKGRRGATPTRTPIGGNRFRLSDTDEESNMSSEEIAEYNRKLEEKNAEIARQDAERRARDLEEERRNGTLKHTSFDKTLEAIEEADRKMHQSAMKSHSFDRLRRAQDSLSQGVNTEVATAKELANASQQYANEQMGKKQQQMHDIKIGFDATATALEMGAAGYAIGHLTVPRLIHTNTGWLGKVSDFFTNSNAQLGANAIGSLADGYQLLTADNKFDKYENGVELGGDTAGIVGGLDIVRNSNIFGKYSKPIDTALDTIGLSAATWDIAKNMPPFSYYYGKLKDYVNDTNDIEDNQYAEGGEMDTPKHWNELSMVDKSDVMAAAIKNGVTTLEEIKKAWDDYADHPDTTHEYAKGGYMPSASIKRNIANWEGSSMKTNRSFEAEAADFNRVIPASIRAKLNQQQLDALYSYGYNVGMGNLKKRVLPMLEQYTQGRAGAGDVAASMWASKDPLLKGLQRRRAWERGMFTGNAPASMQGSTVNNAIHMDLSNLPSMYSNSEISNPIIQQPYYIVPKVTLQEDSIPMKQPQITLEESKEEKPDILGNISRIQNIFNLVGDTDTAQQLNPLTDSFLEAWKGLGNSYAEGGKKATVYKTANGDYTTVNGHPVEQIGWDDNGYARYRDTVTGDLGKAYKPTDDYGVVAKRVTNDLTPEQKADMFLKNYTLAQAVRDNQTASNDNFWIENGREKNPNLDYKGIVGGRSNAAWEQEHPALADWMYIANATPFVVAGYPFAAGASDATMATSAGQAISGPLVDMAMQIGRSKWMPWADALTTAYFGQDAINNDVKNGNVTPETVLELAPMARAGKGITEEVSNFANKAWHSTYAQYPRYYLGKLYFGKDTELPTLYRKMNTIPQINNGKLRISPVDNRLAYLTGKESPLITNMTTDVPVRSHNSSWAKDDVLAFSGKTLLGKHVISTRPSDTFTFGDIITTNPEKVTYISGKPRALKIAEQRGMKTLSSEQALDAARNHVFGNNTNYRDYEVALQNIARHNFKSPTLKDYKFMDWVFQPQYKSRVIPFQDLSNPTMEQLNNSPEWVGALFGNQLYRDYLSNPKEWRNVLYHPASSVEYQFRKSKGIEFKDEIPNNN